MSSQQNPKIFIHQKQNSLLFCVTRTDLLDSPNYSCELKHCFHKAAVCTQTRPTCSLSFRLPNSSVPSQYAQSGTNATYGYTEGFLAFKSHPFYIIVSRTQANRYHSIWGSLSLYTSPPVFEPKGRQLDPIPEIDDHPLTQQSGSFVTGHFVEIFKHDTLCSIFNCLPQLIMIPHCFSKRLHYIATFQKVYIYTFLFFSLDWLTLTRRL